MGGSKSGVIELIAASPKMGLQARRRGRIDWSHDGSGSGT